MSVQASDGDAVERARDSVPDPFEGRYIAADRKVTALAASQRAGRVDASFAPADLLAVVLGVTGAWFYASEAPRTFDSKNPWSRKRLAQFRRASVEASTRILRGEAVSPVQ